MTARKMIRSPGALALALLLAVVVLMLRPSGGPVPDEEASTQGALSQPLRVEITSEGSVEEFVRALRVHHYRLQPLGSAEFIDSYHDTEDWTLYRSGYSIRLRRRSGDPPKWSLKVERERHALAPGESKLEEVDSLPAGTGERLALGQWSHLGELDDAPGAATELKRLLLQLDVSVEDLRPRTWAHVQRTGFDVSDKGRAWFRLDHELWRLSRVPSPEAAESLVLEYLEIDTRLGPADPELGRRVRTLRSLVQMVHGVRPTSLMPHERAIEEWFSPSSPSSPSE